MPTADVVNMNLQTVGSVELDERLFGTKVREHVLHEVVMMQRASMRQGTASTKTRGEVRGSGRKLWKQKGTGRARVGSIRSPLWRHGGIVFGPRPRKYGYAIPKKKYHLALCCAISGRFADGKLLIVDNIDLDQPKTGLLAKVLKGLGDYRRALILYNDGAEFLMRAAANLPHVTLLRAEELNVYDVLRHDLIVIPKSELHRVETCWATVPNAKSSKVAG
jgi:large subunit ribosomal protein L4